MAILIFPNIPPWSQAQRGVQTAEIGVAIRRFQVRYFPETNERLQNNVGQTIARAITDAFSKEVTIEAEVTSVTTPAGIMTFTLATACSIANQYQVFKGPSGTSPGTLLLDEVTETQERAGWRSINMRLSSNPLI